MNLSKNRFLTLFFIWTAQLALAQSPAYHLSYSPMEKRIYNIEIHETAPLESEDKSKSYPIILKTKQILSCHKINRFLELDVTTGPVVWSKKRSQIDSLVHPYSVLKEELLQQGTMTIDSLGIHQKRSSFLTPFCIPLPSKPIQLNGTWEFNQSIRTRGVRKSEIRYQGHCILYDIQKKAGETIAVIVINASTESQGEYKYKAFYNAKDLAFTAIGTSTQIAYFNIDKGCIQELISEQIHTFDIQSDNFSKSFNINSKLICKLQ